jgi:hypothetical protein
MKEQPLLYINAPWMKRYEGANEHDKPIGKFGFTLKHPMDDHCQFNFTRFRRKFYAHVPGGKNPNLKKLGAARSVKFIGGVTVVLTATDPDSGGRVVVGWYRNATVWKTRQTPAAQLSRQRMTQESGDVSQFSVEAPVAVSKCLPPGRRPRLDVRESGPGQSPFWYGNKSTNKQVRQLIAGKMSTKSQREPRTNHARGGWIQDPVERLKIETNAMSVVERYYSENGYDVQDVSGDNCGYDLRARSQATELHLEVKGCKRNTVCIELTPNEYSFAKNNHKTFRLCVVLDALKERTLRVFRPKAQAAQWYDDSGDKLSAIEKIGAIIRA